MKTGYLLALAMASMIGCGGSSSKTTTLSGFTVDIDLLSANLAMNASITAPALIAASCVKNTPVYGIYEDGGANTATVMADAMCNYTVNVRQNTVVHMVAAAQTPVLNTYSQDRTMVGTSPQVNVPAHVCTSNVYSAPMGVASLLSVGIDQIEAAGICMFGTLDNFQAPFVALTPSTAAVTSPATGWSITSYQATPTSPTTGPTFAATSTSPIGIYGIYNSASITTPPTTLTTITIQGTATGTSMNTYAPFNCDVKPGFITFGPVSPVSMSTH
jgi:hypothetical protein